VDHARLLLTVEDAADALAVSRAHLYTLLNTGEIPSVKIGRARRVPADQLRRFVERMVVEAAAVGA
jgi:excisionase family DNA binding protein